MTTEWTDCGTYWQNMAEQGSPEWHAIRNSNPFIKDSVILTGSQFGEAVGINPFGDNQFLAYLKASGKKKKFTPEALARMKGGTENEVYVRNMYEAIYGVKVKEVGLAVPKWYPYIGASLDGQIGEDGAIEIKYSETIKDAMRDKAQSSVWNTQEFSHIFPPYYAQIQGGLAITGRKWCDYVVYSWSTKELYTEKIFFNEKWWLEFLFPRIRHFVEKMVPYVKENMQICHEFYKNQVE